MPADTASSSCPRIKGKSCKKEQVVKRGSKNNKKMISNTRDVDRYSHICKTRRNFLRI
jgi:hypothetical protein